MSGPKGGSYSYQPSAEELRRREAARRAELRAALVPVAGALADLRVRCAAARSAGVAGAPDVEVPAPGAGESGEELARVLAGAQAALAAGEQQLAAASRRARLAEVSAALAAGAQEAAESSQREAAALAEAARRTAASREAASGVPGDPAAPLRRLRARAAQVLAAVPADADADALADLSALAQAASDCADAGGAARLVDALAGRAARAAADAEGRREVRARAAEVLAVLAGRESPDAAELRRRAGAALASGAGWDPALPAQAAAEVARLGRLAEELAVAQVLAESLQDLGYEVGERFERVLVGTGRAYAHRAAWGQHALQVRVDPASSRLALQVVRRADPGAGGADGADGGAAGRLRDSEVETEFCAGLEPLLESAAGLGVEVRVDRRHPVGGVPVVRVDDAAPPAAAGRRRDRRAEQALQVEP